MSRKSCLSFIRRHISNMKDGQIFTTRDCLIYGKRSNVDNALFKMVRECVIIRLTSGVFTRWTSNFTYPSALELAIIKARAFGKQLLTHGADTAAKCKMIAKGNKEPTFYVDGSSSRFRYRRTYVYLKKASKKRLYMPDDNTGLAIRGLWHAGREKIWLDGVHKVAHLLNTRAEMEKVYRGKAWMPAWLGDHFLTAQYVGPFGPGKSIALSS
jgi:hypothetical protein